MLIERKEKEKKEVFALCASACIISPMLKTRLVTNIFRSGKCSTRNTLPSVQRAYLSSPINRLHTTSTEIGQWKHVDPFNKELRRYFHDSDWLRILICSLKDQKRNAVCKLDANNMTSAHSPRFNNCVHDDLKTITRCVSRSQLSVRSALSCQ